MIVFITSVRHPDNSTDYSVCWEMLGETLSSVCNQDNTDFRVIVVANEILHRFTAGEGHSIKNKRDIENITKYTEFVEVDFPARGKKGKAQTGIKNVRVDKGCKLARGLLAADKYDPDYIMFVDADDFISKNIAGYVNNQRYRGDSPTPGWTIDRGYILIGESWKKENHFSGKCGSCHILNYHDLLEYKNLHDLSEEDDCRKIKDTLGHYFVEEILGSHRWTRAFFAGKEKPMLWYPERAAIYNKEHGQNHSHAKNKKDKSKRYRRSRSGRLIRVARPLRPKLPFHGLEPLKYRFNVPLPENTFTSDVIKSI